MLIRGSEKISAILYTGRNDVDYLLSDQATSASVVTTIDEQNDFLNPMDGNDPTDATETMIGKVVVLPGGTTTDVPAGDVTIVGLDLEGNEQTDLLTFLANASTAVEGAIVFQKVISVSFIAQDGAGATYDVGIIPDLDILVKLLGKRLLETRLIVAATIGETEDLVATVENPDATIHNFELSADAMNGLTIKRNTGINVDGLDGFKFHWVWASGGDEDWGFVAVYQNQL